MVGSTLEMEEYIFEGYLVFIRFFVSLLKILYFIILHWRMDFFVQAAPFPSI